MSSQIAFDALRREASEGATAMRSSAAAAAQNCTKLTSLSGRAREHPAGSGTRKSPTLKARYRHVDLPNRDNHCGAGFLCNIGRIVVDPVTDTQRVERECTRGVIGTPTGNAGLWCGSPPLSYRSGRERQHWRIGFTRTSSRLNVFEGLFENLDLHGLAAQQPFEVAPAPRAA